MLSWIRRRRYRTGVVGNILAGLFAPPPNTISLLRQVYPGIDRAIEDGFIGKRAEESVAVDILGEVLSGTVDEVADEEWQRGIMIGITSWLSIPNCAHEFTSDLLNLGKLPENEDGMQWRIKWAMSFVTGLRQRNKITRDDESCFYNDVLGALAGKASGARVAERLVWPLHRPVLSGDGSGAVVRSAYVSPVPDLEEQSLEELVLSGEDWEIRVLREPGRTRIVRKDNGQILTHRCTLKKEELEQVPLDAARYTLVNFQPEPGEPLSCVIADEDIVGDMRAFWWSLAKTHMIVTDRIARDTPMSHSGYTRVFAAASASWERALEKAGGSIEYMRNESVPCRNLYFEEINALRKRQEGAEEKLGVEITLAMVLATQSEDPSLEMSAYRRFKRFIWQPGEEPSEFHDEYD